MDNLINIYKEHFGLNDASFSRIEHEEAIIAVVYKISQPNGNNYILKISRQPNHYFCEVYFLKFFANKLPVPKIIKVIEPGQDIDGAILMQYLPGILLDKTNLSDTLVFNCGSMLAKIHSNKVTGYGDLTQPHNLSSNPASHFSLKFEESLSECSTHLPKALIDRIQLYFNTHINLINSVDGPCMTHRDFRPGNVIINDNKIQGIIDWASARAGFAEEDFSPLEFGEWSDRESLKKGFLMGYASVRSVPKYNNIMPLLRLNRAIATIGFTVKSCTWDNVNAGLYQRNCHFLEAFITSQSS